MKGFTSDRKVLKLLLHHVWFLQLKFKVFNYYNKHLCYTPHKIYMRDFFNKNVYLNNS